MNIKEFSLILLYSSILLLLLSILWIAIRKRVSSSLIKLDVGKKRRKKMFVEKEDTLYNALLVYPELENYLYYKGLKAIRNPIVKKAFTKKTTFEKVAKALGKDVDEFMEELNSFIESNYNG